MNLILLLAAAALLFALSRYAFSAVQTLTRAWPLRRRRWAHAAYWTLSAVPLVLLGIAAAQRGASPGLRVLAAVWLLADFFGKLLISLAMLADDLRRLLIRLRRALRPAPRPAAGGITRSEFLAKAGLLAGAAPALLIGDGVLRGAHNYQIRRITVPLPGLPAGWDGARLVQLSDIHAGSFWDREAVARGVQLVLDEQPDLICFTGDLVNSVADEMRDYAALFGRLAAPLGVYSVLGNHDYGDYAAWPDAEAKARNLQQLKDIHREMGWDLLINAHRILRRGGDPLALIGVENWSAKGRFPKYGKLDEAYAGAEAALGILLSHDPSHWRAQVLPGYPRIGLTLSGHTHGFQFGIEAAFLKWSPVQYLYPEWAGLYQEGSQYLYVNRGFGYLAFPGRIGMPPEITVIELRQG